tara:strand:+ start:1946 stop:2401 length:456 start_codon:yes stop_codon:yes gene_type:complete
VSDVVIVPFQNEHADQILKQGLNSDILELKPEHKKYAYFLKEIGMSFTGLVNNNPIAAGGVFHLWDGVAEGWVLVSKEIYKYPIFCAKHIKKRTETILKANKIKRLQTSVKADCTMALRFAKWLGLKEEGLMKSYGPDGSDFVRLARIMKQ